MYKYIKIEKYTKELKKYIIRFIYKKLPENLNKNSQILLFAFEIQFSVTVTTFFKTDVKVVEITSR